MFQAVYEKKRAFIFFKSSESVRQESQHKIMILYWEYI